MPSHLCNSPVAMVLHELLPRYAVRQAFDCVRRVSRDACGAPCPLLCWACAQEVPKAGVSSLKMIHPTLLRGTQVLGVYDLAATKHSPHAQLFLVDLVQWR